MSSDSAHLYDAAKDAIELNYAFENEAVETLLTLFNDTTPKLLSLYEKREFLTYFFLGTHTIPALTPQQAYDFKTTFDMSRFPANGIPAYITWLNENGNNYKNTFPYYAIDGDGDIKPGKWKIGYISDIINDFTDIINNQHNYGNWLNDIKSNLAWQTGTEKLSKENSVKPFFAKLGGLFASGKFVKYYEDYVKPDIQNLTNGYASFDPYTGNITVKSPTGKYTKPFSKLASVSDDIARKLFRDTYIKDKNLSYQHRFFCILCQWIANSIPYMDPDDYSKEVIESVKTYWDLTPSSESGALPRIPITSDFKILTNTKLLLYINALGSAFLSQIKAINNGDTTFKDLLNGAKMKLGSGKDIYCPFFYVINVDFDSVDPINNPFAGAALTRMNEMIAETLKYRDALQTKILDANKNIINNKSCVSSVTNMSTVIFDENATNNNVDINASCSFDSNSQSASSTDSTTTETTSKQNSSGINTESVQTAFKLNRPESADKDSKQEHDSSAESNAEKKMEASETGIGKKLVIIVIVVIALIGIGIGIWLYKRNKNTRGESRSLEDSTRT
jgi:hypothetical protein